MTRGQEIERAFQRFHAENPHVYRELRQLALQMIAGGHRRIGMKMLFEVLRWKQALRTTADDFKLNNNLTAPYARLLMEREPRLRGVFEIRASVVDAPAFDQQGQGTLV